MAIHLMTGMDMDDQREQIKQLFIGMPFALLRWVTLAAGNTLDIG